MLWSFRAPFHVRLTSILPSCALPSLFEGELSEAVPVVHTTIAGTRIIGRMCAGVSCVPYLTSGFCASRAVNLNACCTQRFLQETATDCLFPCRLPIRNSSTSEILCQTQFGFSEWRNGYQHWAMLLLATVGIYAPRRSLFH